MSKRAPFHLLPVAALLGCVPAASPVATPSDLQGERVTLFDKVGMIPAVSLIVPAGAEMRRLGGIDSSRAEIVMAGLRIEADYGRTGGTQSCDNIPDCVDKTARLDGHAAAWVRFPAMLKEDGAFSERLVFAIRARPEENPAIEPPMYLMLHAQCAAITHCDLAEEIALTAIFD